MSDTPALPQAPKRLSEVLELEQLDTNLFRSLVNQINVNCSLFGGQILAQAMAAAARTVQPGRAAHSLHGYFLLPGSSDIPVIYDVEVTRDGGSFSTRRVVARQRGRIIFVTTVSFHHEEPGLEHAVTLDAQVPDPEELMDVTELMERYSDRIPVPHRATAAALQQSIIQLKPVNPESFLLRNSTQARALYWIRSSASLPDDPLTQKAGLAYLSDYFLVTTALLQHPHTLTTQRVMMASLDHAMWFHDVPHADEWVLVDAVSPFAGGARCLTRAEMYDRNRKLIASVAQEGLIRVLKPKD